MVDLFLVWHENFRVIDTTSGLINMISLSEGGGGGRVVVINEHVRR
jgi:hypothetical protein